MVRTCQTIVGLAEMAKKALVMHHRRLPDDDEKKMSHVVIRDPQHATRYEMTRDEMTREDFIKHWTGRAVYR
ncbi:hypothetical protein BH10CYA1_BH10CYA1_56280 [soil metagenome]